MLIGNRRRKQCFIEVRRQEGASAGPVSAGRGVERAVAADKVVAKGQLGMPCALIADGARVAGGDELARA